MKDKPFLYLLENIDKLDIDKRLIPYFSKVLVSMEQYFEENALLDCMDYSTFFDKYYINDSEYKIKLVVKDLGEEAENNCFSPEGKQIIMNERDLDIHKLCHEFIHSLAWKSLEESKEKKDAQFSEVFLDEGFTEYLAREVTGFKLSENHNVYNENVDFVHFLTELYGKKDLYSLLFSGKSLSNHFFNDENDKMYLYILHLLRNYNYSQYFYESNPSMNPDNSENLFRELEQHLILKVLSQKEFDCDSLEDLINYVKAIAKRPLECKEQIDSLFYREINQYLSKTSLSDMTKFDITSKLFSIMNQYDNLYLYGPDDYARVNLKKEDSEEEISVCIDKNFQPIKSDLDVNPCIIGFVAHESTNNKDRKAYRTVDFKKENVDFTKEKMMTTSSISSMLKQLFLYSDEYTNIVIDELLTKCCNTNLESLSLDELDNVLNELQKNIDPLLYSSISEKIINLKQKIK